MTRRARVPFFRTERHLLKRVVFRTEEVMVCEDPASRSVTSEADAGRMRLSVTDGSVEPGTEA
jgi:hypothetical protein